MIGVNNSEGHGILTHDIPNEMNEQFCKMFIKGILSQTVLAEKLDVATDLVLAEYTKGISHKGSQVWKRVVGDVIRDMWFGNPSVEVAIQHSDDGNPVYM